MDEKSNGIQIAVIQGSVRPGNYTAKALALVIDELQKADIPVTLIDPSTMSLPLPGTGKESEDVRLLQETIQNATGVVIATPEYHGSYSSVVKLVIENLGFPSTLRGKPVSLLGVAAGRIGAIKSLEHLRSICSHVGALVLSSYISIADVQKKFDTDGTCLDSNAEKQIRSTATNLLEYINRHLCPAVTLERMLREESD